MPRCIVPYCKNETGYGSPHTFHLFPFSQPGMVEKWVVAVQRTYYWKPTKYSVVCSDHFEPRCFDRTTQVVHLKKGAVPSIFTSPREVKQTSKEISSESMPRLLRRSPRAREEGQDTGGRSQAKTIDGSVNGRKFAPKESAEANEWALGRDKRQSTKSSTPELTRRKPPSNRTSPPSDTEERLEPEFDVQPEDWERSSSSGEDEEQLERSSEGLRPILSFKLDEHQELLPSDLHLGVEEVQPMVVIKLENEEEVRQLQHQVQLQTSDSQPEVVELAPLGHQPEVVDLESLDCQPEVVVLEPPDTRPQVNKLQQSPRLSVQGKNSSQCLAQGQVDIKHMYHRSSSKLLSKQNELQRLNPTQGTGQPSMSPFFIDPHKRQEPRKEPRNEERMNPTQDVGQPSMSPFFIDPHKRQEPRNKKGRNPKQDIGQPSMSPFFTDPHKRQEPPKEPRNEERMNPTQDIGQPSMSPFFTDPHKSQEQWNENTFPTRAQVQVFLEHRYQMSPRQSSMKDAKLRENYEKLQRKCKLAQQTIRRLKIKVNSLLSIKNVKKGAYQHYSMEPVDSD